MPQRCVGPFLGKRQRWCLGAEASQGLLLCPEAVVVVFRRQCDWGQRHGKLRSTGRAGSSKGELSGRCETRQYLSKSVAGAPQRGSAITAHLREHSINVAAFVSAASCYPGQDIILNSFLEAHGALWLQSSKLAMFRVEEDACILVFGSQLCWLLLLSSSFCR